MLQAKKIICEDLTGFNVRFIWKSLIHLKYIVIYGHYFIMSSALRILSYSPALHLPELQIVKTTLGACAVLFEW